MQQQPGAGLRGRLAVLAVALLAAACGDSGGTGPGDDAPVITIGGVEANAVYTGPVTISIAVSHGSYEATLDGAPFASGGTVRDAGDHVLRVTARDGLATAETEVRFTVGAPGSSRLVIRLLALGANDAGGGGDAILISDSAGFGVRHALVDAGPGPAGDLSYVARRLAELNVDTLELLVLSHAHTDHFDGMPAVLGDVYVKRFVYNGQARTFSGYNTLIATARARADTAIVLQAVEDFLLSGAADGATLTLVPALPNYLADAGAGSAELNEGSLGGLLRQGDFELFLTGDGEVAANQRWRTQYAALSRNVDILKVGHHAANDAIFDNGSSGASAWLDHTAPAVALISANGTSHPRVTALTKLLGRTNTRTYCTNVHGEITVRVAATSGYVVSVARNAGQDCQAGSQATS